MATETVAHQTESTYQPQTRLLSGLQGLKRKEAMLAYLLLLPAIIIIGLFGLFPLVFSAYQSTRAGLNNIVGRPDGFGQYVRAIDNLAYVLTFWMAIFLIVVAVRNLNEIRATAKKHDDSPWIWALPAAFVAVGLGSLLRFVFLFLPGLLEVGEKMRGLTAEERNEQFFVFIKEAWQAESVPGAFWTAVIAIIIGAVLLNVVRKNSKLISRGTQYFSNFTTVTLFLLLAVSLAWLTWTTSN